MNDPIDYAALEEGRDCNYWAIDPTLRRAVRRAYGDDRFAVAESILSSYGEIVGTTIADNADLIDEHGPILHTYDRDGELRNVVEYHPAQYENERLTYGPDAGLVAYGFDAPPGGDEPLGLLHPLSMGAVLSYADPGFFCPASMTAGVALVLDLFDDGRLEEPLRRLTTTDLDEQIEGAMFLTEKQGGSDVGAIETVAEPIDEADGTYALTGEKWFASNIDAEGALALARRPDAPAGTDGLSMFFLGRTTEDGDLNDMTYRRLKDKLGTISVPTGEIELHGARARLVGEPENGFKQMATMLNFERLANACAAVGIMGRCLLESKVHAADREAFGQTIDQFPLMRRDLVEMAVDYEAAAAYTFEAAAWLDRAYAVGEDATPAAEDRGAPVDDHAFRMMRLLVPIAKLKTARMAVDTASYAMEIQGGNGYVREFVTHRMLRDAQVLPIWEGTTNILSLDVLRALERENAFEAFAPEFDDRLAAIDRPELADTIETVREEFTDLQTAIGTLAVEDEAYAQYRAEDLANYVFDVVTAVLLLEAAAEGIEDREDAREAHVARYFVEDRFGDRSARRIPSGDRLALEAFESIVRYEPAEPDAETAIADD